MKSFQFSQFLTIETVVGVGIGCQVGARSQHGASGAKVLGLLRAARRADEAGPEGVIYVSFGSVLKASVMSEDKRLTLLNVFGKLKQKVLWKWETEHMEDKPPNVMLHKWLPQQDVLGHPNVKLFVSHGGQSSFQETICHQKPAVS